jgi:hypothetical protein
LAESHTFAWSEEVVGEWERDQAGQGQDEEGKELTLVAQRETMSVFRHHCLGMEKDLPAHRKCSLTTSCGDFRATAVAAAVFKDRGLPSCGVKADWGRERVSKRKRRSLNNVSRKHGPRESKERGRGVFTLPDLVMTVSSSGLPPA